MQPSPFPVLFTAVACTYVASSLHRTLIHHEARVDLATGAVFGLPADLLTPPAGAPLQEILVVGATDKMDSLDIGLLGLLGVLPDESDPAATVVRPGHLELARPVALAIERQAAPDGGKPHLQVSENDRLRPLALTYIAGLPGPKTRAEGAVLASEIMRVHQTNCPAADTPTRTAFWSDGHKGWLHLTDIGRAALAQMSVSDRAATEALREHFEWVLMAWSRSAVEQVLAPLSETSPHPTEKKSVPQPAVEAPGC